MADLNLQCFPSNGDSTFVPLMVLLLLFSGLYRLTSRMKSGRGSRCVTHSECTALGETERKYIFFFFSFISLTCLYFQDLWCLYCKFICYHIICLKKKKEKECNIGCKLLVNRCPNTEYVWLREMH